MGLDIKKFKVQIVGIHLSGDDVKKRNYATKFTNTLMTWVNDKTGKKLEYFKPGGKWVLKGNL